MSRQKKIDWKELLGSGDVERIGAALVEVGEELDLRWKEIGDAEVAALAKALRENSSLQTLYLSLNSIGAEGAAALAQALSEHSSLQTLDLRANGIGDEGAAALAQALESNHACWGMYGVKSDAVTTLLSRNKGHANAFVNAARHANTAAMQEELDWGVPIDTWPDEENTALTIAVENNDLHLCKWLTQRGADPLCRPVGYKQNAVELARKHGHTAILDLFSGTTRTTRSTPPPEEVHVLDGDESLEIPWSDLDKGELLGEGGFAFVYKGMLRGSTPVAIKMMRVQLMDEEHAAAFNQEVRTMKGLRHHNMITLHGVCTEPERVCMVTELCELGSLHKLLHGRGEGVEGLSMEAKVQIARDVADGMAYLHGYKPPIMHRDLKPENVLLDRRGVARISDFGLSRVKEHTKTKTKSGAGSWQYMAPELLLGDDDDDDDSDSEDEGGASSSFPSPSSSSGGDVRTFDEKVDVFAFGMVLWEMMHEVQPYSGKKNYGLTRHMAKLMKKPDKREKINTSVCPSWAKKLIEQCWATQPSKRPPFTQIIDTLDTVEMMHKEQMHSQVEIVSILHEMQGTQAQILDAVQFDHEAWQAHVTALDSSTQQEVLTALRQLQSDTESLKSKSGHQSKAIRLLAKQQPQMRAWLTEVQTRAEAQGLNAADVDVVRAQLAAMEQDIVGLKSTVSSQSATLVDVQQTLVTVEISTSATGEDTDEM